MSKAGRPDALWSGTKRRFLRFRMRFAAVLRMKSIGVLGKWTASALPAHRVAVESTHGDTPRPAGVPSIARVTRTQ